MFLEGVTEFKAALDAMVAAADAGARELVAKGGSIIEANSKRAANGRPGPNVVSGSHRRSFHVAHIERVGPGVWSSETGPSMVYSRRLELGFVGVDSLGRVYNQPPYPSLGPGLKASGPELRALQTTIFGRSLKVV